MIKPQDRKTNRSKRHRRVRVHVSGTLAAASTVDLKAKGNGMAEAAQVGKAIAAKAKAAGVSSVVFDRGGFLYHGRIKALADAAREAGLEF
jgi:large subunit ribosomal protein L18